MKRVIILVILLVLGVFFAGCDVTYEIQKDNSILITIECDEDDVEEFSEDLVRLYGDKLEFDEGDLDSKEDLEDILDDIVDEYDDLEGEITVKSFKRDKHDDFVLVFNFIPNSDIEDALNDGIAVGSALDILDQFAEDIYDDDFEDIYEDEFSDDIDDEVFYAYDKNGDEMTDKEMEEYFDKAKLSKLKAAHIQTEDVDVYVPGKVEMIISPDDSVDIDDGAISYDEYVIIIYKTGGNPLVALLIVVLLVALGVGGYFANEKYQFLKKKDSSEVDLDIDVE